MEIIGVMYIRTSLVVRTNLCYDWDRGERGNIYGLFCQ